MKFNLVVRTLGTINANRGHQQEVIYELNNENAGESNNNTVDVLSRKRGRFQQPHSQPLFRKTWAFTTTSTMH